jgi:transcription antitermination protein NusB
MKNYFFIYLVKSSILEFFINMFSRRLLRIKVLQILYAHFKVDGKTYVQSEKDLTLSIHKSYDLYHYLMLLLLDLRDFAESKIELARHKKLADQHDLHPATKFIENKFILQLEQNDSLKKIINKKKLNWNSFPEIIKKLYNHLLEMDFYKEYINSAHGSYNEDKKLVIKIYTDLIMNYEDLYSNLEEQNIYWIDDVDFIIRMIIKTLRKFRENGENTYLMPMFHDPSDIDFATTLLRKTILSQPENKILIKESAKNWELERIAFTDYLIMQMAITEVIEFGTIPVKVTMNEFIEISKIFSTRKSSQFINGILDNVFKKLKSEKKIMKRGRGLIGEQKESE